MNWTNHLDHFANWLRAGHRLESTIETRRRWVTRLADAIPDSTPETITTEQILQWLAYPDWKPVTRKSAQVSVRRFFYWLHIAGYRDDNPTENMLSIRVPRYQARHTPDQILTNALGRAETTEEELILLLAACAGLRRTEIATLHTNDITDGWIIVTGKGGVRRIVPIHPLLEPYLALKTSGYFLPGRFAEHRHPDWVGRRISKLLGPGYTCHQLRHWFATTTYGSTGDLRAVQELLGHASIATTQIYVGVDNDKLAQAVAAIPHSLPVTLRLTAGQPEGD